MEDFEDENLNKLLEKQQELKKKLVQAHRAGMSMQIVEQIQNMIDTVEFEIYNKSELDKLKHQKPDDDTDDFIIG